MILCVVGRFGTEGSEVQILSPRPIPKKIREIQSAGSLGSLVRIPVSEPSDRRFKSALIAESFEISRLRLQRLVHPESPSKQSATLDATRPRGRTRFTKLTIDPLIGLSRRSHGRSANKRQLIATRLDPRAIDELRNEAKRRDPGYTTLTDEVLAKHAKQMHERNLVLRSSGCDEPVGRASRASTTPCSSIDPWAGPDVRSEGTCISGRVVENCRRHRMAVVRQSGIKRARADPRERRGTMDRRTFLHRAAFVGGSVFLGPLHALGARVAAGERPPRVVGLRASGAERRFMAPRSVQLSGDFAAGKPMSDGQLTPGLFDGMGAFPGPRRHDHSDPQPREPRAGRRAARSSRAGHSSTTRWHSGGTRSSKSGARTPGSMGDRRAGLHLRSACATSPSSAARRPTAPAARASAHVDHVRGSRRSVFPRAPGRNTATSTRSTRVPTVRCRRSRSCRPAGLFTKRRSSDPASST